MTYMQSNLDLAGGIQELSLDEISFVSGGHINADKMKDPGLKWGIPLLTPTKESRPV